MPKRLLLEGSDLQTLLLRVRAEMGPTAKVIKAERVRTGGIAGFFAKERFELTIEVPEPTIDGPHARPAAPLRVPTRAAAASGGPAASTPVGDGPGAAGPTAPAAAAATPVGGPTGLDALLAAADAADAHDDTPAPVSTEQDAFASILDSVRQLATETRQTRPVGTDPAPGETVPGGTTHGGSMSADPVIVDPVPGEPVVVEVLPDAPAGSEPGPGTEPTGAFPEPVILDKRVTPAEFVVVRTSGATLGELGEVGFPREILARLPASRGRYALSEVFSHVPRAPRLVREPASVVVVAGQGEGVVETALALARRLGLPDSGVALAGRLPPLHGYGPWVLTGISARRLRAATVESESPLVVALGVGADASDWSVATGLVEAFDPDQLWADVEADRSMRDVRRWLRAVGHARPFDALAARNVTSCAAPAAVLDLGVPVGTIDTLPATAPVWAAAVNERLEDAVWD